MMGYMYFVHFWLVADIVTGQSLRPEHPAVTNTSATEERLLRLETGQNAIRTRIPRLESHMDVALRRLEQMEQRFNRWEKVWEERWNRWEEHSSATPASKQPELPDFHHVFGTLADERLVGKIDNLNSDTQMSIDELLEKILRLEERLGHHERSSTNQLERLLSITTSNLELAASFRTESFSEHRKTLRLFDNRINMLTNKMESNFNRLWYVMSSNATGDKWVTPRIKSNEQSKVSQKRSSEEDLTIIHELISRKKHNSSGKGNKSSGRSLVTRNDFNETAIMDEANFPDINKSRKSSSSTKHFLSENTKSAKREEESASDTDSGTTWLEFFQEAVKANEERFQKFFNQQSTLIISKLANMYNELWQQGKTISHELSIIAGVVNSTKWDMDDGFRTIIHQTPKSDLTSSSHHPITFESMAAMETIMKEFASNIRGRLDVLEDRTEIQFENLKISYGGLLESCSHHHENDAHLEIMVTEVLERLVHVVGNNSQTLMTDINEIQNFLKKHNDQTNNLLLNYMQKSRNQHQKIISNEVPEAESESKLTKLESNDEEEEKQLDGSYYSYTDAEDQNDRILNEEDKQ